MIKDYKVDTLRKHVWACRAICNSKAPSLDDILAIRRLGIKLKDAIEDKYESDLDYIESHEALIRGTAEEEAEKKAKGDPKKRNEELGRILSASEEYQALSKKEKEIYEAKISFALDKPVKIKRSDSEGTELQKLMPERVGGVKYRSQEIAYNPWSGLMDLLDEGFVEFEDDEPEENQVKKPKRSAQ